MAVYKSALGRSVDMAALVAKNEKTRAVGNMKVNARGDMIDSHGKVIKAKPEQVNNTYSQTVGNPSARPAPTRKPTSKPVPKVEELTASERELEDSFEDDAEVEQIKADEVAKSAQSSPKSKTEYSSYDDFLKKTGKK